MKRERVCVSDTGDDWWCNDGESIVFASEVQRTCFLFADNHYVFHLSKTIKWVQLAGKVSSHLAALYCRSTWDCPNLTVEDTRVCLKLILTRNAQCYVMFIYLIVYPVNDVNVIYTPQTLSEKHVYYGYVYDLLDIHSKQNGLSKAGRKL